MKTVFVRFWYGSGSEDEKIDVHSDLDPSREWLDAERDKRNADWSDVIPEEDFEA